MKPSGEPEQPQPPDLPQRFLDALESAQNDERKQRAAAVTSVQNRLKDKLEQFQKQPDLEELALVIEVLDQHRLDAEFSGAVLATYAPLIEQVMASAGIEPGESLQEFFATTPGAEYAWKSGSFLGGSLASTSMTARPPADKHRKRQPSQPQGKGGR